MPLFAGRAGPHIGVGAGNDVAGFAAAGTVAVVGARRSIAGALRAVAIVVGAVAIGARGQADRTPERDGNQTGRKTGHGILHRRRALINAPEALSFTRFYSSLSAVRDAATLCSIYRMLPGAPGESVAAVPGTTVGPPQVPRSLQLYVGAA
jgi:hypothetical protein